MNEKGMGTMVSVKNESVFNIKGVRCYEKDGIAFLNLEDVSRGLGFTQIAKSGNEVVRWERVNGYLKELGFIPTSGDGGEISVFPQKVVEDGNKPIGKKTLWSGDFEKLACMCGTKPIYFGDSVNVLMEME